MMIIGMASACQSPVALGEGMVTAARPTRIGAALPTQITVKTIVLVVAPQKVHAQDSSML